MQLAGWVCLGWLLFYDGNKFLSANRSRGGMVTILQPIKSYQKCDIYNRDGSRFPPRIGQRLTPNKEKSLGNNCTITCLQIMEVKENVLLRQFCT